MTKVTWRNLRGKTAKFSYPVKREDRDRLIFKLDQLILTVVGEANSSRWDYDAVGTLALASDYFKEDYLNAIEFVEAQLLCLLTEFSDESHENEVDLLTIKRQSDGKVICVIKKIFPFDSYCSSPYCKLVINEDPEQAQATLDELLLS